jgi:exodeoxyribonuclease VII large subunit
VTDGRLRYHFSVQILTVSEITHHIKGLFDDDPVLQDVWVQGEVSNHVRSAAGHMYFTLKDAQAQIRCVLWRSQVAQQRYPPQDGTSIVVHGYASVYEVQGAYQLYVDLVQPLGAGALFAQYQQLKDALEREGLFAAERKRPLPPFPQRVGVVTSPRGAAIRDILHVLGRRYPLAEVIVAPTLVQGIEAPPQIAAAIEALNAYTDVDVIIVARGGGSLEELWAFNDERVARAIFSSRIPIITGVGHETDYTIADFVADLRAPTPSAAAEMAVPDQSALLESIGQTTQRLGQGLLQQLSNRRLRLGHSRSQLSRLSPLTWVNRYRQTVDEREGRVQTLQRSYLVLLREQLRGATLRLRALSPQMILERGYAVVSRLDTGKVVVHTNQVSTGTRLEIRVSDGQLRSTVD